MIGKMQCFSRNQENHHSGGFKQAFDHLDDERDGRDRDDLFHSRSRHYDSTSDAAARMASALSGVFPGSVVDNPQPIDFSVKSPSSPGGESYCSHSSSRNKRSSSSNGGTIIKDEQYWLRREKNNAAAKRSRDARRQKEEQTKQENQILRAENDRLKYKLRTYEEHVRACPNGRALT